MRPPLACSLRHAQEEAALARAQRVGAAASRRAAAHMAEQWLDLVASPEWRALSQRFPEAVARLEAVAGEEGRGFTVKGRRHNDVSAGGA